MLIPDFKGHEASLQAVLAARPDVLNHNIETVRPQFRRVRPQGDYDRTLALLERARRLAPDMTTKSGFMVGLGESDADIHSTLTDLRGVGVELVTIGQYLQPSLQHVPVVEYVTPERYATFRAWGQALGFRATFAGPFVRSSFHAGELLHADEGFAPAAVNDWIALEAR